MDSMYGSDQYKDLLTKQFDDKDINWIQHTGLKQLKLAQEILQNELPFWKEKKDITFRFPTKEEQSRRSFHYPSFKQGKSLDCHLTQSLTVDTIKLEGGQKKPYRLAVYIHRAFNSDLTRYFENQEKMDIYFEKLKKKIEKGYAESWRDLPEKISFLEKELLRCNELRNEKMKRKGSGK